MNRIKELRLKSGLKQADLAQVLKVAQNTLSTWENGRYEPDNEMLRQIADYFECSIDYLLGRSDIKNEKDNETLKIDSLYLRLAKGAQDLNLDKNDVDYILGLYQKFKEKNEE